ncbi:hypothetical protein EUA93_05020 [Nocardioides oleivorans]|uniref:DUF642 domain-containing protein n=1 Tax=Nocardioides oleivorans TaxID=273676 RepID=A0A4Q2RXC1_9ACTN|nr:hypothetical protein [Nocardioides oleivorans]RYB93777.1 hypothetical protein EUA93_05020 [Nocardioides oleivorans]
MEPLRPTRRTLTRSAAWTVPVVAVATAAPAFAASPCNCPEFYFQGFPASGTLGNGWTLTSSTASPGGGTDRFENGSFITVADPPALGTLAVTAARSICVTSGRTYRFTYSWTAYLSNPRPQTSVLQVNGVTVNGSTIDTSTSTTAGTRSVTWLSNVTGNVTLSFVHTTVASLTSNVGDDITITNIAGTCS